MTSFAGWLSSIENSGMGTCRKRHIWWNELRSSYDLKKKKTPKKHNETLIYCWSLKAFYSRVPAAIKFCVKLYLVLRFYWLFSFRGYIKSYFLPHWCTSHTFWGLSVVSRPLIEVKTQCSSRVLLSTCASHFYSTPTWVPYSPLGNPSKWVSPLRPVGEHAPRECMCIVSPDAQEDIDMVIVSTPVKRCRPLGAAIHPSLPFLCGSCRVIGWMLRTWWT